MESDQFMPEYWPANRIIGKLEKALVKAENILGLIQSEQIAGLAASKVTGLLTSAQIEAIEAAKVSGQLTNAQLKEIEAAKITGEITNSQIQSLEANKLLGKLTNSQIESIEAAKLTGQITETQIGPESVTTEKLKAASVTTAKLVAGAVTAEKVAAASITAEKLAAESVEAAAIKALTITAGKLAANSVTAEKIAALSVTAGKIAAEAITAEKLAANSVTAAKIVAGSVTAEKLSVVSLSAISADLGNITSGVVTGATIQSSVANPKVGFDSTGLWVKDIEGVKRARVESGGFTILEKTLGELAALNWKDSEGKTKEAIYGLLEAGPTHILLMEAQGTVNDARFEVRSSDNVGDTATVRAVVNSVIKEIIDSNEKSHFLQLHGLAKSTITFGESSTTYPGGANASNIKEVEHQLGVVPQLFLAVAKTGLGSYAAYGTLTATKAQVQLQDPFGLPVAGTVGKFFWVAIG